MLNILRPARSKKVRMLKWRWTNLPLLRNNYQSRNLIDHYPFWVISSRNSTSFTRPFLAGRRVRAGHETICPHEHSDSTVSSWAQWQHRVLMSTVTALCPHEHSDSTVSSWAQWQHCVLMSTVTALCPHEHSDSTMSSWAQWQHYVLMSTVTAPWPHEHSDSTMYSDSGDVVSLSWVLHAEEGILECTRESVYEREHTVLCVSIGISLS